ncbi:MAG: hypothetical protein MJ204_09705 [Bacteroidales bacterium]|nr:hypothetical protein [Bacteroidales bacterium]
MNKSTQTKVKTNWLNTMFVFILSTILSYSVFAGNTWELTDGKIAIPYNEYGTPGALGESAEWQAGNANVLPEAVNEATGNTAWTPEDNEFFQINISGVANFTGNIYFYIVDERPEANYWGNLSPVRMQDHWVFAGEYFNICQTIQITQTTTNVNGEDIFLSQPSLVFVVAGTQNSSEEFYPPKDFEDNYLSKKTNCELYVTKFEVTYQPNPKFEQPLYLPCLHYFNDNPLYTTDVASDYSSFSSYDYVNVHFTGKAENDITKLTYSLFLAGRMGNPFQPIFEGDIAENIKKGDDIDISFSIQINSDAYSVISRAVQKLQAETNEETLFVGFSNADFSTSFTKSPLYAGPTTVEQPTSFEISYNLYSSDRDEDDIADNWQSEAADNLLAKYVFAHNGTTLFPNMYDEFQLTMTATMNGSGLLSIYLVDSSPKVDYWASICDEHAEIEITEGVEFSIDKTFITSLIEKNGYRLTPNVVFEFRPTLTSSMDGFDKNKTYIITPSQFNIAYKPSGEQYLFYHSGYGEDIDGDGTSDRWFGTFENLFAKATGNNNWAPAIGEKFAVTFKGKADFDGTVQVFMIDDSMEAEYWSQLSQNTISFDVIAGKEFSANGEFVITKTIFNEYDLIPKMRFEVTTLTSTMEGFDAWKCLSLYLDDLQIEYTPAEPKPEINPEDYSAILYFDHEYYGIDNNNDGKSDTWSFYDYNNILANTAIQEGYSWSSVIDGDKIYIHVKGVADFSGKVGFYIMDSENDWKLCSGFNPNIVEYGQEFEIYDTLIIKNASTTMTLRANIGCNDLSYPSQKHLYLNEFSVKYSNQYCKVTLESLYNYYGHGEIEDHTPNNEQYGIREYTIHKGTKITINAIPTSGGSFLSWNDGITDLSRVITITDEDRLELKLDFDQPDFLNYENRGHVFKPFDTIAYKLPTTIGKFNTPIVSWEVQFAESYKEDQLEIKTKIETKISNDTLYIMPSTANSNSLAYIGLIGTLANGSSSTHGIAGKILRDSLFPTPQIALVTVSKESGKNLVVWQKFETDKIDHYNIYRETEVAGEYKKIAEVPYSETSIFEDTEADPLVRAWRYKISASPVDTRYTESELSKAHKTIHLTKNMGMNNTYNLIWDKYEGLDFSTFVVIRNYKVGTSEIYTDTIAEIPSNVNSYTDLNPQKRTISYYVAIKLKDTIDVNEYLKAEAGPFVLAMSNIAEIENEQECYPTAVNTVGNNVIVYAANKTIYVKNATVQASVYNSAGALVTQSQNDSEIQEIAVEKVGIYFVKIANKMYTVIVK